MLVFVTTFKMHIISKERQTMDRSRLEFSKLKKGEYVMIIHDVSRLATELHRSNFISIEYSLNFYGGINTNLFSIFSPLSTATGR